jgi:hypothetical protein
MRNLKLLSTKYSTKGTGKLTISILINTLTTSYICQLTISILINKQPIHETNPYKFHLLFNQHHFKRTWLRWIKKGWNLPKTNHPNPDSSIFFIRDEGLCGRNYSVEKLRNRTSHKVVLLQASIQTYT